MATVTASYPLRSSLVVPAESTRIERNKIPSASPFESVVPVPVIFLSAFISTTFVSITAFVSAWTLMVSSRMRSNPPVPVTSTFVGSTVPSMKSISLVPVIFTSFAVLAKVESVMVISPDPAVSRPTLFPETVTPLKDTSLAVCEPYLYAAPALLVMVPERSPPRSLT
ncbi:MAG: Uncharacterised protein [Euryarchaeota archaeon UBA443]|nr:MAG: Uncharacterised protein [Euryarchaeota archaeon UBA443]